nr:histidinol-phosphate transaminase [uncultured Lachnoanaerobaculum sp.]
MHGGRLLEFSKSGKKYIDFSASINPYGIDPNLKDILKESIDILVHYPNQDYSEIKALISRKHDVSEENIYLGNGANSIIFRLFSIFDKEINICIPTPSFETYRLAAESVSANIVYYDMNGFKITDRIFDTLSDNIDVLVLTNPNNPTGYLIEEELLQRLLEYCKAENIFVLIDECFLEFVLDGEKYSQISNLSKYTNLAILRSLTKLYAFPGLRFGYLLTENKKIIENLNKLTPSWDINTLALEAAKFSLTQNMSQVVLKIQKEKSILLKNLKSVGIEVFDSKANFLLCRYKKNLSNALLNQGVIVRNCSDYRGMDDTYFRVAVRTNSDNMILFENIKELIER